MPHTSKFIAALLLLFTLVARAQEPLEFADDAQEQRFRDLTTELRCLVCQNQDLADSEATLAQDLRQEIFEMMQAGKTDDEIKTYLVDRYGDFVLYRPPVQGNTLALWVIPAILLLGGAGLIGVTIRRRNRKLAELQERGSN